MRHVRIITLSVPLGWCWPYDRHLSQWFLAPAAAHEKELLGRVPEAPHHSFPPKPAHYCGTMRWCICNGAQIQIRCKDATTMSFSSTNTGLG